MDGKNWECNPNEVKFILTGTVKIFVNFCGNFVNCLIWIKRGTAYLKKFSKWTKKFFSFNQYILNTFLNINVYRKKSYFINPKGYSPYVYKYPIILNVK